jgi:alcohol dehydrogenase (cytochrome c)
MTGTYDAETDTLFWGVGNPYPAMNGDERQGDNLYTASVLALNPGTGDLKWYYQFTPHDLYDWDAGQTPLNPNTREWSLVTILSRARKASGFRPFSASC